jgi:hypothetical protein
VEVIDGDARVLQCASFRDLPGQRLVGDMQQVLDSLRIGILVVPDFDANTVVVMLALREASSMPHGFKFKPHRAPPSKHTDERSTPAAHAKYGCKSGVLQLHPRPIGDIVKPMSSSGSLPSGVDGRDGEAGEQHGAGQFDFQQRKVAPGQVRTPAPKGMETCLLMACSPCCSQRSGLKSAALGTCVFDTLSLRITHHSKPPFGTCTSPTTPSRRLPAG